MSNSSRRSPRASIRRIDDLSTVFGRDRHLFFLFGRRFALQLHAMERVECRPNVHSRRIIAADLWLAHWLALLSGEILHVYPLAGFLLLLIYVRSPVLIR